MKYLFSDRLRPAFACIILFLAVTAWSQVPEQRLKSFGLPNQSGDTPAGLLLGADGALYGIDSSSVFKVNPDGTAYGILHNFDSVVNDGQTPNSLIQARDGKLYGTTAYGGTNAEGIVFAINTDGTGYAVLYNFGNSLDFFGNSLEDGSNPSTLIQGRDGSLYGMTSNGGTNTSGTVFHISVDGSAYNVLYSVGTDPTDTGANPGILMQGTDGMLYATTISGLNFSGTVFKIGTNGLGFDQLHDFGIAISDGTTPSAVVQGADGALFGTTESGGTNVTAIVYEGYGTIFTLKTDGSGYTVLHNFTGASDGGYPVSGMVCGRDGTLYGTAGDGDSIQGNQQGNGYGVVFRLNEDGSGYEVIHHFSTYTSLFANDSTDGKNPNQLLQAVDGTLYGITESGGAASDNGPGTIFMLNTNGSDYSVVWDFSDSGGDGASSLAGLILGQDGALYGTASAGGAASMGTAFKLNSDGTGYQILHSFGVDPTDGLIPEAAVIQGSDGMLYGTTSAGGYIFSQGVIFKMNPDGSDYSLIYSFDFLALSGSLGAESGDQPVSPLIQGRDGNLYGTTSSGGTGGWGTVFKINTNGTGFSILHSFTNNAIDGQEPLAGLLQGKDGALYGTTDQGGTNDVGLGGDGTIFKLNTDGSGYVVLHDFGINSSDGRFPSAALAQGSDGALYGTTQNGGTNQSGTVFKLNADRSGYAVLYNFGSAGNDGLNPSAALVQGRDGYLYGTTQSGGMYDNSGTAFKIATNGAGYMVFYNFGANPTDGIAPQGGLVQGQDGAFYGTTSGGGDLGLGTVFRLGTAPFQFTSFSRLANNTSLLSLSGSTNTTCRIDASTNLVTWTTLTNILDVTGAVQFTDQSAPNSPRRFYRAFQSP